MWITLIATVEWTKQNPALRRGFAAHTLFVYDYDKCKSKKSLAFTLTDGV